MDLKLPFSATISKPATLEDLLPEEGLAGQE